MCPLVQALDAHPDIDSRVCVTAQHREMLDQVSALFGVTPDIDLNVMSAGQTISGVLAKVVAQLEPVLAAERPDWVLVQGDTTTAMAAALAGAYAGSKVGHVEAGLRTFDKTQPFPEELNRLVAAACADLHFAPTATSAGNLLREGHAPDRVLVTGNTVIDALLWARDRPLELRATDPLAELPADRDLVLVTAHRRENFGEPFRAAFGALAELARRFSDRIHLLYPVHPNPNVVGPANEFLSGIPNVTLTDPLDYHRLVHAMDRAHLVITDSGGIQEEAPSLGKPVLVLRDVTERPEAVESGTVELVGCDPQRILDRATTLLTDEAAWSEMAQRVNPYGDGRAVQRIVAALTGAPVEEFRV
jgi:UDP-N-acetylglucosamine 2-epimerase (non-hydrolysing)